MKYFVLLFALALMVVACAPSPTLQPTTTPIPATATPVPATATIVPPTATPIPATGTPVLPTATRVSLTVGPFTFSSPAFVKGKTIPVDYTCKGVNISPALTWTEPPAGTQSFAIIMYDPEATWTHWVLYNIPASTRDLKENLPKDSKLSDGNLQAITAFMAPGYWGPCPSYTHTYEFTLYALDSMLSISPSVYRDSILTAMEGHILASAKLTGTFP